MKKTFIIAVFFTLLGCKTNNNALTKDDYEIMQIVVQNNLNSYTYNLEDDIALKGLDKGSKEYKKKINELYNNESYESDYYYYLDETLFTYKNNWYVQELFAKNDFDGSIKNLIPLKIDYSKIKTKKHLIRVDKNSPLRNSTNCVKLKLSRIIYDGSDKAVIIIIYNEFYRGISFFKKEGDSWSSYGGGAIPYELYEKKIDL